MKVGDGGAECRGQESRLESVSTCGLLASRQQANPNPEVVQGEASAFSQLYIRKLLSNESMVCNLFIFKETLR